MTPIKVKIGHQNQANESIFLYSNGEIVCGNYKYSGRYKMKFRETYNLIVDLVKPLQPDGYIDVSKFRFWTAMDIYEEHIEKPWKKAIGARVLDKLSIETRICIATKEIQTEFLRAINTKWKRVFRNSNIKDPATPTQGWHLVRNPRLNMPHID